MTSRTIPLGIRLVLLLLAAVPAFGRAEEGTAVVLDLDQAVRLALDNNPALRAAGFAREGADEGVAEARSRFAPRVDLSEVASRTDNPTMVFSNLLGQARFGAANFAIASLNEPDPLTNYMGRVTVAQPIYAGGRLRAGLDASRRLSEAARGEQERRRQETIAETVRAYHGVLLARRQRGVAEAAREAAGSHLSTAENLVEAGLAVPSDVLRLRVRLGEIEEMRAAALAGETIARAVLEAVLGIAPATGWEPDEPAAVSLEPPDPEAAVAEALRTRSDLAAARAGAEAAGEAVRAARGARLPQAGFLGTYEINNDTPIGSSGRNWTAMVAVSLNVFDGSGTAAGVRRGRAEEARAAAMAAGMEGRVRMEVLRARAELEAALVRREASRAAVSEAEEALRIVRDRYENGLATITDLLDQETALTAARARAARAEFDVRDGDTSLRLAMGTLDAPAAGAPSPGGAAAGEADGDVASMEGSR